MAFTARTETYARGSSLTSPYSFTINKATGVVDGDIMFMYLHIYLASPPTIDSVPSGWTQVATNAAGNSRWYLYYKIAASEGTSYSWSLTASCRYYALNVAYSSGNFKVESISDISPISNTLYGTADVNCRAADMSVSIVNSPLIYFASVYNTTVRTFTKPTAPTTDWVEDADQGNTTPDISVTNGSMIWSSSGATGNMDIVCSTSITTNKHAFAIALKPYSPILGATNGESANNAGTITGEGVLAGSASQPVALVSGSLAGKLSFSGSTNGVALVAGDIEGLAGTTEYISGHVNPPFAENLVRYSEELNISVWDSTAPAQTYVSATNAELDIAGNLTLETITTTETFHNFRYGNSGSYLTVTPGATYTFSWEVKRGTMTDLKYSVYDQTNGADIIASTSYYSLTSSTVTRVSFDFTVPAGCVTAIPLLIRDSGVTGTVHLGRVQVALKGRPYIQTGTSNITGSDQVTGTLKGKVFLRGSTGITQISDDFESYNTGELNGQGSWVQGGFDSDYLTIVDVSGDNRVNCPDSTIDAVSYRPDIINPSQFAQVTIDAEAGGQIGVVVRSSGVGATADYFVYTSTSAQREVARVVNGAWTGMDSAVAGVDPGDTLRLEINGNILKCYYNGVLDTAQGGGTGIYDVSSYGITSGSPGIHGYGSSGTHADDFLAGAILVSGTLQGKAFISSIGPQKVSNGTFDDATDWTIVSGWSITGGSALYNNTGDGQEIYQLYSDMLSLIESGKAHKISFNIHITSGTPDIFIADSWGQSYIARQYYVEGLNVRTFVNSIAIPQEDLAFYAYNATNDVWTLDDVVVKEITNAPKGVATVSGTLQGKGELQTLVLGSNIVTNGTFDTDTGWNKSTDCTISDGLAHCDSATSVWAFYQAATNGLYRTVFEIKNYVSGSGFVYQTTPRSANGIYVVRNYVNDSWFVLSCDITNDFDFDNVKSQSFTPSVGGIATVSGTLIGKGQLWGGTRGGIIEGNVATDNFNSYSNGDLAGNGSWVNSTGAFRVSDLAGNQVINSNTSSTETSVSHQDKTYSPDQFSEVSVAVVGIYSGPAIRTGSNHHYCWYVGNSSDYLMAIVGGVEVDHWNVVPRQIFNVGDVMRMEIRSNVITLYRNGNLLNTYTDTNNYVTSGYPGVGGYSASGSGWIDNFRCGDFLPIVTGLLQGKSGLVGVTNGVATVSGDLGEAISGAIAGVTEGITTVSGTIQGKGELNSIGLEIIDQDGWYYEAYWDLFSSCFSEGDKCIISDGTESWGGSVKTIITTGNLYKFTFDFTVSSGTFFVNSDVGNFIEASSSGTYRAFSVVGADYFVIASSYAVGSIDAISIKEVTGYGTGGIATVSGTLVGKGSLLSITLGTERISQTEWYTAAYWDTFGSNFSQSGTTIASNGTGFLWYYNFWTTGDFFRTIISIERTSGSMTAPASRAEDYVYLSASGTYVSNYKRVGSALDMYAGSFVGSITALSIKEITQLQCVGTSLVSGTLQGKVNIRGTTRGGIIEGNVSTDDFEAYTPDIELGGQGSWVDDVSGTLFTVRDNSGNQSVETDGAGEFATGFQDKTYSPDQFAEVTIDYFTATIYTGVAVRVSSMNHISWYDGGESGNSYLVIYSAGTLHEITWTRPTRNIGGVRRLEVRGNTITCLYNGAIEYTYTDLVDPITSGYPGVGGYSNDSSRVDNFRCGDLLPLVLGTLQQVAGVGNLAGIINGVSENNVGLLLADGQLAGITNGSSLDNVGTILATGLLQGITNGLSENNAGTLLAEGILAGITNGVSEGNKGTFTGGSALQGSTNGVALVSGHLVGRMIAHTNGTALLTGVLLADGRLYGVTTGTSLVNGILIADGQLRGVTNGVSLVSGILRGAGRLQGSVSPSIATVTGTIFATAQLDGSMEGYSLLSGTLLAEGKLAGVINGTSLVSAMPVLITQAGHSNGVALVSGTILAEGRLYGSTNGTSNASLIKAARAKIYGITNGIALVSGLLTRRISIAGVIHGIALVSGRLTQITVIYGITNGIAQVTAILRGKGELAGQTNTYTLLGGTLGGRADLSGEILTTAQVSGSLLGLGVLSGVTEGVAYVTGWSSIPGMFRGEIQGTSLVTGNIQWFAPVSGTINGQAIVSGAMWQYVLGEIIQGNSTITAIIVGDSTITPTMTGNSTITATIADNSLIK